MLRPHLVHAVRKLKRSPAFAVLAIVTLAVALGANAAIFNLVDAILLQPLPWEEPEEIVYLDHQAPGLGVPRLNMSRALYRVYAEHAESFESTALYDTLSASVTSLDEPLQVAGAEFTPGLLDLLGAEPARGRPFTAAEGEPGGPPVVILSHDFWARRLGGDPRVLGRTLEIDGTLREVVAVMPPDFAFPQAGMELWLPLVADPELEMLGAFGTSAVGRLRDGVGIEQAAADLRRFSSNLGEYFPDGGAAKVLKQAGFDVVLRPLREEVVGEVGPMLWVLSATVGFVLLLAAFNVANLFLARAEQRQRETAVRVALGAGRRHLAVAALLEGWALSFLAAGAGLGLAHLGLRAVRSGVWQIPRMQEIGLDPRSVVFTALLALVCGCVFGAIAYFRFRFRRLGEDLKDGGRSAAGRRSHGMRRLLVAGQTAIALLLLVGAGLMGRSYLALTDVDPGFRADESLSFRLSLPPRSASTPAEAARAYDRIADRLRALPGVESVGLMGELPLSGRATASGHRLEGKENLEVPITFDLEYVSEEYFDALGIPVIAGRALDRRDWQQERRHVVVSRGLAATHWPGQDAIGKKIFPGTPDPEGGDDWFTVVGVAGEVHGRSLQNEPTGKVYYPLYLGEGQPDRQRSLAIRGAGPDGGGVDADAVRRAVWEIDPSLPLADVRPLSELVENARASVAFTAVLLAIAALVAVLLGAVGTYGVIAYLVAQRTGEIGVRMALGADRGDVQRLVLREGLLVTGAGAVVGFVAALGLSRYLQSILFQVEARDPLTFAVVPLALLAVATLACLVPARRAASTDPSVALRHD